MMLAFLISGRFGRRLDEIAREFRCSAQTARRDLGRLQEAGFPIERKKVARHTVWSLTEEFRNLPPVPFGPLEAAALAMAQQRLRDAGDDFFASLVGEMLDKLKQGQAAKVSRVMKHLEESFVGLGGSVPLNPGTRPAEAELSRAVRNRLVLQADLREGRRTRARQRFAPISVQVLENRVMLQAFCYAQRGVRTLELDQLAGMVVTEEMFEPHWQIGSKIVPLPSPRARRAFPETVVLEFDTELERSLLISPLHATQTLVRSEGRLMVTLRAEIGEDLVSELVRYGPRVRIVSPSRLGKLLAAHHRAALMALEERPTRDPSAEPVLPLVFE